MIAENKRLLFLPTEKEVRAFLFKNVIDTFLLFAL